MGSLSQSPVYEVGKAAFSLDRIVACTWKCLFSDSWTLWCYFKRSSWRRLVSFFQRLFLFCFLPAFFSLGFAVLWLLRTTHLLLCDSGCCVFWGKSVRLSFLFSNPLSHCVLTKSLMKLLISFCSFPKVIPGVAQYREQALDTGS